MKTNQNLINAIGIIVKSRKYIYGEKLIENIKKISGIIIVCDISKNSLEKITNKCINNNIKFYFIEELTSNDLFKYTKIKNIKSIGIIDKNMWILIENSLSD